MNTLHSIPPKSLERLVIYRRLLSQPETTAQTHIFSHQLARLAGNTPAQVRRDLMIIGYHGSPVRGYPVDGLRAYIEDMLGKGEVLPVALVGVGNLGRALLAYFNAQPGDARVVVAFDADPQRAGRVIGGVPCHHVSELETRVRELGVTLGVIAVPGGEAQPIADRLIAAGVTGLLNFAPVPLHVSDRVMVDDVDIGLALEKVAYFSH
jgi:redox-sensing transcriptional repressor